MDTVIRWNLDQIILSFRKPFLSFYIYLLLIWLFMFILIFLCCFLTTERVYGKIREIATFLEVLEFRSIFTSPLRFGWSKSFEWLRRRCQRRLKRWPIKMGFRRFWANVYGESRWICRKVIPLHIGRCLWAHTRKNQPKFQHFQKGSDPTNISIDSFCR